MPIYLGVGSSIGDATQIFNTAINTLKQEGVFVIKRSKPLINPPFGGIAKNNFTNEVWEIETKLPPIQLMNTLQSIEDATGRSREKRWDDRPIDLDILSYHDIVLHTPELIIPHPGIPERDFVLIPWSEIVDTDFDIPVFGNIFAL